MTLDTFIKKLGAVASAPRLTPRRRGGMLRLVNTKLRPNARLRCLCPVTAVCFAETGKFFEVGDAWSAGARLGLRADSITAIVLAADSVASRPRLRARLERAMFGKAAA